jgi:hypothetical protein
LKHHKTAIFTALCAVALSLSAYAEVMSTQNAEKVFKQFFITMDSANNPGLPDKALQKKLNPYLSKKFLKALKHAKSQEDGCIKLYANYNANILKKTPPGQAPETLKPPVYEGYVFVIQNDPPDSYKIVQSFIEYQKAFLMVEYTSHDKTTNTNFSWKNKIALAYEGNSWKIDDFISVPEDTDKGETPYRLKQDLYEYQSCKSI